MARKLKVTLVRSPVHRTESQKETIKGLGLRYLNHYRVLDDSLAIRGMIRKVQHLVAVDTADTESTLMENEKDQQAPIMKSGTTRWQTI